MNGDKMSSILEIGKNKTKCQKFTPSALVDTMLNLVNYNADLMGKTILENSIEAYNGKCAYCGVSTEIIPWKMFEIDHLIPKEADRFGKSKANAGYIENLVLSCYDCNRSKSDLEFHDQELHKIHPDKTEIIEAFIRDDNYYIRISEKKNGDKTIKEFYEKVDLGNQLHRLDYLLLNMRGLCKKITDKHPAYGKLMEAIDLLQHKRNVMR